jgi:hypothetical protein
MGSGPRGRGMPAHEKKGFPREALIIANGARYLRSPASEASVSGVTCTWAG